MRSYSQVVVCAWFQKTAMRTKVPTRNGIVGSFDEFKSAADFVEFLANDRFRSQNIFDVTTTGTAGWIFRGQRNVDWKLFPTAFRIDYSTPSKVYKAINKLLNMKDDLKLPKHFPSLSYRSSVALAQHHGIPTRLLYWTESALFAAFFAANSARMSDVKTTKRPNIGVFYVGVNAIDQRNMMFESDVRFFRCELTPVMDHARQGTDRC